MKKIGEGSVKDLYFDEKTPRHLYFHFSDRVSVFDYGALPEDIPHKGRNLENFARKIFEVLEGAGVRTAWDPERSLTSGKLACASAEHPKFPEVKGELKFIPLEIIFRLGVPPGSSLLKRRPDLKAFDHFEAPLVEFTTKLESQDRLLSTQEAAQLAGSPELLKKLEAYTVRLALTLKSFFKKCGLELWDGKIECALSPTGEILMVDAITPDELRLSFPGLEATPLSKDLLRLWLGATTWAFDIKKRKETGGDQWKNSPLPAPPRLGAWRVGKLSDLYSALAQCVTEERVTSVLSWLRDSSNTPKVYLIGNGGREAALRDRLIREGVSVVETSAEADTVWVSPDAELAQGIVDEFESQQIWTYGPRKAAARLEWSKEFGREVAGAAGLRIPQYSSDAASLRKFSRPPVVKKDGLAAGKGVVVTESFEEAEKVFAEFSRDGKVLLEERLEGFEASAFFAIENGYYQPKVYFLGTAKDFKRRLPGDEGPNTGGMGAYAPHPEVGPADVALFEEWALKTVHELARRGESFHGILYLGLMKDKNKGWELIEYNARFGDPETQSLTVLWSEDEVLRPLLSLSLRAPRALKYDAEESESVLCLALVNPDYPEPQAKAIAPLAPWNPPAGLRLFRTASLTGRVAYVVAKASSLQQAGDLIFSALVECPWKDALDWRPDILK